MKKILLVTSLNFILGLASNLIAGWFLQDVWSNFFTPQRLFVTSAVVVVLIIAIAKFESLQSFLNDNDNLATVIKNIYLQLVNGEQKNAKRERALEGLRQAVRLTWIDGYLSKSDDGETYLKLGFRYNANAVQRGEILRHATRFDEKENLENTQSIYKIYEKCGGNLLILGEPGSGKTFTLLQLAKSLLNKASTNSTYPVPVYLTLSSWSRKRLAMLDWLSEEMLENYQISRGKSIQWLHNSNLILLLDGLDEISIEHRQECIKAINLFKANHQVDIVVCSRKAAYESMQEKLNLTTAIDLLPLDKKEVLRYLQYKKLDKDFIFALLNKTGDLELMSQSPFMLKVISDVYKENVYDADALATTNEINRDQIIEKYIQINLNRLTANKDKRWDANKSVKWLRNLARNMNKNNISCFHIDRLSQNWINNELGFLALIGFNAGVFLGIIEGLILGITLLVFGNGGTRWGLAIGVAAGITAAISNGVSGAVSGLLGGRIKNIFIRSLVIMTAFLVTEYLFGNTIGEQLSFAIGKVIFPDAPNGITSVSLSGGRVGAILMVLFLSSIYWHKDVQQIEKLRLSWPSLQQLKKSTLNGLRGGIIFGLVAGLDRLLLENLQFGLFDFIRYAIILFGNMVVYLFLGILFGILLGFLQPREYQNQLFPNQGIRNLFSNALHLAILGCAALGGFSLWLEMGKNLSDTPGMLTMSGIEIGLLGGFIAYGGGDIIKHYTLRVWLQVQGNLPLDLVPFLNHMADAALLRQVGGGYIFIHPYFQEYFASTLYSL